MSAQEAIQVAVVIERTAKPNAWQDWAFKLTEVLPDEGAFGDFARCLHDDGKVSRWLHPGFRVELYADECKGYFLNLTSGQPVWFVSWVVDECDSSQVKMTGVSLSYIEADRRMTAEEVVENLPLDAELCEWLRVFTNTHFRPDSARKVRAMSFLSPQEREKQAATAASPAPAAEAAGSEGSQEPAPDAAAALTAPGVDPRLRNEALRKLFLSDPHFRQSDGLDVAIDEVVQLAQSPLARQQKIKQARAMGLLDDELLDQDPPPAGPARGA